jgi:SPX domain protein involved in polyphosphate accumulation
MSFRKEKKYRLTISEFYKLKEYLLKDGMNTLHPPRIIHSVYYDSADMRMFYDSEEGLLPRKKVRVRWYNKNTEKTLEKKMSSIEGRFKVTNQITHQESNKLLVASNLMDDLYGSLLPCLRVSYKRSYFTLKGIRITFDEEISYKGIRDGMRLSKIDPERVVELKVPLEVSDDFIETVLPYPTSRFSKYSRGILMLQGQISEI